MASIVSRYLNWRRTEASRSENRALYGGSFYGGSAYGTSLLSQAFDDWPALTGAHITANNAHNSAAVWACVSLLAETVGSLPLKTYRRVDDRVRKPVSFSDRRIGRLARLLDEVPNPEMSSQSLWETVVGHRALWGGAFVYVERGSDGWPIELWPLHPGRIQIFRDGSLSGSPRFYMYTLPDGKVRKLRRESVMEIPGLSLDGFRGYSPVAAGKNAIAIEQAASQYAAQFFANSATPSSVLTIPVSKDQSGTPEMRQDRFKARLKMYREAFEGFYGGLDRAQRLAVIEEGVDWKAAGMSNEAAQFLESRKFQTEEICRLFRIPPHMISHTEKSTSWGTGIEQQSIGFLTYTLRPILSAITSSVSLHLGLVPGERTLRSDNYYCEFETKDLLKGDIKTRYDAFAVAVQNRWLSPEDVAALEDIPFNPERPSTYENPNTLTDQPDEEAPAPTEEDNARLQRIEQMALEFRDRPQLPPNIEVNSEAPVVHLPDFQVPESRVEVNVPDVLVPAADMEPVADAVRGIKAATADAIAELAAGQDRIEQLLGAETVREVDRDENGKLIRVHERRVLPESEAN